MIMNKSGKYIDIHTHILPEVDDGSRSMEETIIMLQIASEQQIETIIATPHYMPGEINTAVDILKQRLEQVQVEANKISPEMKILLGNEIFYSNSIVEDLKSGKALTLADSRYVLVEFSIKDSDQTIYQGLSGLIRAGYIPILAHVERYRCYYKKEYLLNDLIEAGCYIQMNSRSLVGSFLNRDAAYYRSLINQGLIHLIGSDCHDEKVRIPHMAQAVQVMRKKCDKTLVDQILFTNPLRVLNNAYI
jgi:protein-tyrosine phosphatase